MVLLNRALRFIAFAFFGLFAVATVTAADLPQAKPTKNRTNKNPFENLNVTLSGQVVDSHSIQLVWEKVENAKGYNIYINDKYTDTAHITKDKITNLESGREYIFYIVAFDGNGFFSQKSNRIKLTPVSASSLATPRNIKGKGFTKSKIEIYWDRVTEAEGYTIFRNGQKLVSIPGTYYVDQNLSEGTTYSYQVQSFKKSSVSKKSNPIKIKTQGSNNGNGNGENNFPPDVHGNYQLQFSDEFNSWKLDENKWDSRFMWGPNERINEEDQYYLDIFGQDRDLTQHTPFKFDGSSLKIRTSKMPSNLRKRLKAKHKWEPNYTEDMKYISGIITSYKRFEFTYGYIEMRAKLPKGNGLWPALWLLNSRYENLSPEIDIMEFLGHDPFTLFHTYHVHNFGGKPHQQFQSQSSGIDFTLDFHTYGLLWERNLLIFYVDGIEVHRVTGNKVSSQKMYLLANLAVGGSWGGNADSSTPIPSEFKIDYVRVFQK